MSTQYTPKAGLPYWQLDDPDWHLPYQRFVQRADDFLGPLAVKATLVDADGAPTGLGLTFAGGTFLNTGGRPVTASSGTATATASATTYVWLTEAGVLTTGAAWPATNHVKLAAAVADATKVTTLTDARVLCGVVAVDKQGFFGATPVVQPADAGQAALTDSTGGDTTAFTLAALGSVTALTNSTGVSTGTTVSDVGASFSQATLNANFAALAIAVNGLVGWRATQHNNTARLARLLGQVRAGLVNLGLLKGSA